MKTLFCVSVKFSSKVEARPQLAAVIVAALAFIPNHKSLEYFNGNVSKLTISPVVNCNINPGERKQYSLRYKYYRNVDPNSKGCFTK